jgi:hypothetical protein
MAQIQQALPGLKRDGNTVLSAVTTELLHDENSTTRASGVLIQSDFIRGLLEKIQAAPEEVIEVFESIRRNSGFFCAPLLLVPYSPALSVTDPTGVRFSVTGNVLDIHKPRSTWNKYFGAALPVSCVSHNQKCYLLTNLGAEGSTTVPRPPGIRHVKRRWQKPRETRNVVIVAGESIQADVID